MVAGHRQRPRAATPDPQPVDRQLTALPPTQIKRVFVQPHLAFARQTSQHRSVGSCSRRTTEVGTQKARGLRRADLPSRQTLQHETAKQRQKLHARAIEQLAELFCQRCGLGSLQGQQTGRMQAQMIQGRGAMDRRRQPRVGISRQMQGGCGQMRWRQRADLRQAQGLRQRCAPARWISVHGGHTQQALQRRQSRQAACGGALERLGIEKQVGD